MCSPIIELSVTAVKEEDLGVDIDSSTVPTEETHCLHPAIPNHIYRRLVVDQPVTGEVPLKILGVILCLVNNNR